MLPSKLPAEFPRLETERLVLREITTEDREAIFHNYSAEENTRYIMEPFTRLEEADETIAYFQGCYQKDHAIFWGLSLKDDPTLIGTISLDSISLSDRHAEIAYDLNKDYTGKGYMTEAAQAVLAYGFG